MRMTTLAAATLAGLGLAGAAFAEAESQEPIKLTLHDWSGQLLTTTIMGKVLAEAGYNVEYVQADYIAQFAGLKTGVEGRDEEMEATLRQVDSDFMKIVRAQEEEDVKQQAGKQ